MKLWKKYLCRGGCLVYIGKRYPVYGSRLKWDKEKDDMVVVTTTDVHYYCTPHYYHKVPTSYVRNTEHKKKELTEQEINRREWRAVKKVRKDKAKCRYRRGPGRYYKQRNSRLKRRKMSQALSHERWEEAADLCVDNLEINPWLSWA